MNTVNYFLQRNVSEKYAKKKPLKEMARCLLANKSFCGGGVLQVIENSMTEEQINAIGYEYALHPENFEKESEMEIKCEQVGNLTGGKWDKMHDIAKRVYGTDGLAPKMHTCGGGNLEPKIAEPLVGRIYQQVRADSSVLGTLTRNCGADLKRNGQGIIYPLALDEQNQYIRQDGIVGTLTTAVSSPKHNNRVIEPTAPNYRIRKLTPKECGRLMGVKDKDIDKISKNQSNSSQYHLYGDSIVVPVLVGIFAQMLGFDSETEIRKTVKQIKGEINNGKT